MIIQYNFCKNRYSAARKQFGGTEKSPEWSVIEYQSQQCRLFPYLAASFVILKFGQTIGNDLFRFHMARAGKEGNPNVNRVNWTIIEHDPSSFLLRSRFDCCHGSWNPWFILSSKTSIFLGRQGCNSGGSRSLWRWDIFGQIFIQTKVSGGSYRF